MKTITIFVCTFLLCFRAAASDARTALIVEKAVDILSDLSTIVEREIVVDGVSKPTEQTWAFSTICKLADKPGLIFKRLAETGSYYGMIGLRKYDLDGFRKMRPVFRGKPEIYILSHDFFRIRECVEFMDEIEKDVENSRFSSLVWDEIPEWYKTVRVRDP